MVLIHELSYMKILEQIIDSLFPPRKSELLVRNVSLSEARELHRPRHVVDCISLSEYKHPVITALIKENKFYKNQKAAKLLAELVVSFTASRSSQLLLIPIPLGRERLRQRGYNQVYEVLKNTELDINTELLIRNIETTPQTNLSREARLKNVAGSFSANKKALKELRNLTLVIVDDVLTTGATMEAARATLAPHLHPTCKLICLAIAH